MRKLNASDLLKAISIMGKIGLKAKDSFVLKEGQEVSSIALGMAFMSVAMEHAEKDLKEFLSSIAEMTPEEFDQQDFDFPLQVIEHLAKKEDLKSFLQRVNTLAKSMAKK